MDSVENTIRMNNLSKELRKYGFASDSQEAIAQAGTVYGCAVADEMNAEIELAHLTKAQLHDIINKMQRLWMFKETAHQRMEESTNQLVKVTEKLNELIKTINIIEMNQTIFDKKMNVLRESIHEDFRDHSSSKPRQKPRHVEESSPREKEVQQQLDKPIDRNGVAPADVSIEKIFYSGSGRK